jgi:hypothetical protein
MVFCSSCDGGPLKLKKKNGRASRLQNRLFELITGLSYVEIEIPFMEECLFF